MTAGERERESSEPDIPHANTTRPARAAHPANRLHRPVPRFRAGSTQDYRVGGRRFRLPRADPAAILVIGFAAMILVGTVLLALPISSSAGTWTAPIDAFFTATSAVCTTGLVVVDTGTYWSGFGQAVILVLVQLGGFGFMTSSTLLLLVLVRGRTRLRDRILVQQSLGAPGLGSATSLVRRVAVFTILAEVAGAVILTVRLAAGGEAGTLGNAAWWGIFHSVSAFNNSGFDLTGEFRSLIAFAGDPLVLGVFGGLVVLGGLGYAIVADVAVKRRWGRLALETKVVLATTVALLLVGTALIGAVEWNNARTLGSMPEPQRVLGAAFQSTVLRSAGFSALDPGALLQPTLFLGMALMFIGGASGSTAGGIKVNTFSVLLIAIVATVRGRPSAEAFGRRVPHEVIYRALSVALLSIAFVFATGLALTLTTDAAFNRVLFEAVSAFSTTGLSTNLTPELGDASRLILSVAMFAGRLGPLTLALALATRARPVAYRRAVETIRIG